MHPDRVLDTVRAAAQALLQAWPQAQKGIDLAQVLPANTDALIRAGSDNFWKLNGRIVLDLLIASGERANLEIKQQVPNTGISRNNLMRTMTALANSGGGIVLLGVTDDAEVVGVEPDCRDQSMTSLDNMIGSQIRPELLYKLRTIDVEGRLVLLIEVATGTPPYMLASTSPTVYVRTDAATTVAKS